MTRRKAPIRTNVIFGPQQLAELEEEWSELHRRTRIASPFQSPDWVLPWVRMVGSRRSLVTLTLRRGSQLIGILPLQEEDGGVLRPMARAVSDRLDVLLDPAEPPSTIDALLRPFWDGPWESLELEQNPGDSFLSLATIPIGGSVGLSRQMITTVLHLRGSCLRDVLPKGIQANLRTARNRAERFGKIRFEKATSDSLSKYMDVFFSQHQTRWPLLSDQRMQSFHRDVARAFCAAGKLRLHALWIDQHVAAVFYGFADAERVSYYLGGFSPEFASCSPGNLVLAQAIEDAIADGATVFDFLCGAEIYKYAWGVKNVWNFRRTFLT
jgi:CelD/BcsL family acetyltransferase involved in cellulose biosynthesis